MHKPSTGQELCVQLEMQGGNSPMGVQAHDGPAPLWLNKGRGTAGGGEEQEALQSESLHYIGAREAALCPRAGYKRCHSVLAAT